MAIAVAVLTVLAAASLAEKHDARAAAQQHKADYTTKGMRE